MKKWKLNFMLLIAISFALLINVFAEDVQNDEDDDGVTIEAEKIVNSILCFKFSIENSHREILIKILNEFIRKIQSQHMKY